MVLNPALMSVGKFSRRRCRWSWSARSRSPCRALCVWAPPGGSRCVHVHSSSSTAASSTCPRPAPRPRGRLYHSGSRSSSNRRRLEHRRHLYSDVKFYEISARMRIHFTENFHWNYCWNLHGISVKYQRCDKCSNIYSSELLNLKYGTLKWREFISKIKDSLSCWLLCYVVRVFNRVLCHFNLTN